MIDRFDYILSVILWPILLVGFGLLLIVQVFHDKIPDQNEVVEIKGTLSNYQIDHWGRGVDDYNILLTTQEHSAFFIDRYMNKRLVEQKLRKGVKVKFHIERSYLSHLNKRIKIPTWSTTIDQEILQPLGKELQQQSKLKYSVLPIMGTVLLILGIVIHIREKKRLARTAHITYGGKSRKS